MYNRWIAKNSHVHNLLKVEILIPKAAVKYHNSVIKQGNNVWILTNYEPKSLGCVYNYVHRICVHVELGYSGGLGFILYTYNTISVLLVTKV